MGANPFESLMKTILLVIIFAFNTYSVLSQTKISVKFIDTLSVLDKSPLAGYYLGMGDAYAPPFNIDREDKGNFIRFVCDHCQVDTMHQTNDTLVFVSEEITNKSDTVDGDVYGGITITKVYLYQYKGNAIYFVMESDWKRKKKAQRDFKRFINFCMKRFRLFVDNYPPTE